MESMLYDNKSNRHLFLCSQLREMIQMWILMATCIHLTFPVFSQINSDSSGFLNIDCGLQSGTTVDNETGLTYISDYEFVKSGDIGTVSTDLYGVVPIAFQTLRSFNNDACYKLTQIVDGQKYLVRASFLYGNYDKLNSTQDGKSISFSIFLGSHYWKSIHITDPAHVYREEALTIGRESHISVCLMRNNDIGTVPFISVLEVRPLTEKLYPTLTLDSSLVLKTRLNLGGNKEIRFPNDTYDRIWEPWGFEGWNNISANKPIANWAEDPFEVPMTVLQTAVSPKHLRYLRFRWLGGAAYFCFHSTNFFVNDTNIIVFLNGIKYKNPFRETYTQRAYFCTDYLSEQAMYNFTFVPGENGGKPVLNALEIYSVMNVSDGLNGPSNIKAGNSDVCNSGDTCTERKKKTILVEVMVIVAIVLILMISSFLCWIIKLSDKKRSNQNNEVDGCLADNMGNIVQIDSRQFTYDELKKITSNFKEQIGKGGFGTVFHGWLEDGKQVAVKVLSNYSVQGTKEFLAEVQHLSRIHSKNLLSLVGYCKDRAHLALVYDYMPGGNLETAIRGHHNSSKVLSWEERLRILLEAAQGLEYLHEACEPALIHRDVKTANILLNNKLEAKISDFGLSKAFKKDSFTHISTVVAGTLGYLDPE